MLLLSLKVTLQQRRKVTIVILLPNVETYLLQPKQSIGVKRHFSFPFHSKKIKNERHHEISQIEPSTFYYQIELLINLYLFSLVAMSLVVTIQLHYAETIFSVLIIWGRK